MVGECPLLTPAMVDISTTVTHLFHFETLRFFLREWKRRSTMRPRRMDHIPEPSCDVLDSV